MLKSTIKKHREKILYLVFGVATTLVNWIVYTILLFFLSLAVSNAIAWVTSVIFAFFVNKKYVFESVTTSVKATLKEGFLFLNARIFSGIIDVFGLPLLVYLGLNQSVFGIEGAMAKAVLSIIVIIANYFFSKFIIFKK